MLHSENQSPPERNWRPIYIRLGKSVPTNTVGGGGSASSSYQTKMILESMDIDGGGYNKSQSEQPMTHQ